MSHWSAIVAAPGFCLGIRDDGVFIREIHFLEPCPEIIPSSEPAKAAARQLHAWLQDPTQRFDLPLAPAGTEFRQKVWAQIAAIPVGETRSYGDLARAIGSAPRAVGGACGDNPYPVVVPCHRVVAASGGFNDGLGGFAHHSGGFLLDVKRWLLSHERQHGQAR
ncbi:MAG TPA: methylated-DNA--[protein]-cysteine S-methyltransferase [Rhodocyclaceae bacterium]